MSNNRFHPNSPTACWERNGYKIERYGNGRRKITSPSGEVIFDHGQANYMKEYSFCKKMGFMLPDIEE
ncbi:hypothetical protein ABRP55_20330 [Pectobacterium zantedeschiae]|uniref:hypothetical protein n=1 Tax=Pectobacterium zantedeschiae TaxID=2034769 RepID=UPI0032EEEF21